jgi:predicted DCC family thiol-disulfide oxidoreductase YuxK
LLKTTEAVILPAKPFAIRRMLDCCGRPPRRGRLDFPESFIMTPEHDSNADKKDAVYYDGNCPMCIAIVGKIDETSQGEKFSMKDITKEPLPSAFTRQDVEREMHVVGADGKIYKNAEAILKLLEPYPAWKFAVTVGRLPGIRNILPIGYGFVAANRRFLFGPASRIYWLKVIVGVGFLFGLLLAPSLWVDSRFWPLTPVLNILPPVPYPFDWIIFFALIGVLTAVVVAARPKPYIWLAVALVSAMVFLDQERMQPWVYQYLFMLAALGLFSWRHDDVAGRDLTLNICRFIVASIYFWSGLQKLNPEFFNSHFVWVLAPIKEIFPAEAWRLFYIFARATPFIEMGIGVGLLFTRARPAAIAAAIAMCAFVLFTLGPLGHNWDNIVWPWNITLALIVLVLFAGWKASSPRDLFLVGRHPLRYAILALFGVLPLAYFFNVWDSYLSWSLYSGTTNVATIYMSDTVKARLPNAVQQLVKTDDRQRNFVPLVDLAFADLNVPPYPETRIFKSVARRFCDETNDPREVLLAMRGRLSWFYRDAPQVLNCAQLQRF